MNIIKKLNNGNIKIGVIGLGYVGLPLALEFSKKSFRVIGFDIDRNKIDLLNKGISYIKHISKKNVEKLIKGKFKATNNFSQLEKVDIIIICVPTPLGKHKEPNLNYVNNTAKEISKYLAKGQLVVLTSTTYPGTTEEVLLPILERSGLKAGKDFYLVFSPEREDPGNKKFNAYNVPKIIGGYTPKCLDIACKIFEKIGIKTVPVSSIKVAESAKLLENIYRAVNIALVNELKMIFERMDIDIFEVIEAAATKPFGFQPFYPGPGLGGHCIPIDPFYLSWRAKEYDYSTRFIELAGEINTSIPYYIVNKITEALNENGKSLNSSKILILGMSYKKNIDDIRESPSLKLMDILINKKVHVDYVDPYIPKLAKTRDYNFKKQSIDLTRENIKKYDCVVVCTDHDLFDKEIIFKNSKLIVDTRNMFSLKEFKDSKLYRA
jgi:UDP-N-acetyl-D-glucosamine dehydrogenase